MTFQARPIAPFKIDIMAANDPSSFSAGYQIPCVGTATKTNALISSGQITVYSGSHWRLEYSATFQGTTQFKIQFYDVTNSTYIGQACWGTSPGENASRKGRVCATALILNSEISTSKVVEVKIVSQVGMSSAYPFNGTNTIRIMELPA